MAPYFAATASTFFWISSWRGRLGRPSCGFLQGKEPGRFAPEDFASRGELMHALLRMSGQEAPAYSGGFSDVSAEDPWAGAVAWAVERGIVSGTAEGAFSPQSPVSRSQLAAFLYRLAAPEEAEEPSLAGYRDEDQVPAYARRPLAWALENRLFAGMAADTIHPELPVSRGQLARTLVAFAAYDRQEPLAQSLTGQLETRRTESASRARHGYRGGRDCSPERPNRSRCSRPGQ